MYCALTLACATYWVTVNSRDCRLGVCGETDVLAVVAVCTARLMMVLLLLQVSAIQQERQGTEGLVGELGRQSAALEAWLASHEWKADAAAAALAKGSSEAGALDINKVIVPTGEGLLRV